MISLQESAKLKAELLSCEPEKIPELLLSLPPMRPEDFKHVRELVIRTLWSRGDHVPDEGRPEPEVVKAVTMRNYEIYQVTECIARLGDKRVFVVWEVWRPPFCDPEAKFVRAWLAEVEA